MKRSFIFLLVCLLPLGVSAQVIYDGMPGDSTLIRFTHDSIPNFIPDTSAAPLWQIGRTHKPFFTTDTAGVVSMMTDTLNHYPINANNWFVIKVPYYHNVIVDFWHRYQTNLAHAGGIVDFSIDAGLTWQNIKGPCNIDSFGGTGVGTAGFYSFSDTLVNGEPAFTGTQSTAQYSRIQFKDPEPIAKTTSGCYFSTSTFFIRFRFESDTMADTLAGWIIDSVKIENDIYWMAVNDINQHGQLHISPNPSSTGIFTFPELRNEELYNSIGQKISSTPNKHSIDLSHYVNGMYFYTVTNGTEHYSGRLLKE